MQKSLTKIGPILRTSFSILFTTFCLFFLLATFINLPLSRNNAEATEQGVASVNVTLVDYTLFVWFDDHLYSVKTDAEATTLIRPQFAAYHSVDPENLVSKLDQPASDNELNTSFSSSLFGFKARIEPVSYRLFDFSE